MVKGWVEGAGRPASGWPACAARGAAPLTPLPRLGAVGGLAMATALGKDDALTEAHEVNVTPFIDATPVLNLLRRVGCLGIALVGLDASQAGP